MKNAGGIIGIIAGVFGTGAALVTLLFGGIGAAFNANGAHTVVGLGWGGVLFSFLAIVFGAIVFARPKGAGIALVITSILGAILGGTLVAIFMGLALIGGVLAIIGSKGVRQHAENAEEVSAPARKSTKTVFAWGGGAVIATIVVAVVAGAGKNTGPSPAKDEIAELASAPVSDLRPDGELSAVFDMGSRYTDVQREKKEAEIKGKIVQWRLPVYEVTKRGDKYRIQTSSQNNVIGAFVTIIPRSAPDREYIEGLHTGDVVTFKGTIRDVSLRNLEIEPAILVDAPGAQKGQLASTSPDGSNATMTQSSPTTAAPDQPGPSTASDASAAGRMSSDSGSGGADAQEADESGTAAGTVMKIDTPSADGVTTPFGKLSVSDDNVLLLNGTPVNPHVEGNNSLGFVAQVALKNRRAVLVQNNGGTGCPATYRWVTVSDGGYTVSPEFGSCSDLVKVSPVSETLVVTMPGFAGDSEPAAERKRAARTRMTYVYDGKTLKENGKPVGAQ